jgi:hypothetical protein
MPADYSQKSVQNILSKMTFKFARKLFQICSQPLQPKMHETKEILESRGYFVSQYNLIMKSSESEYAIGMIRDKSRNIFNPEIILVSSVPEANEEARGLMKVLNQEGIYYRNLTKMRTHYKYEVIPNRYFRVVA